MDAALPTAGARRFVVGTAGHIDHGKTALVKALTGVDTDRWAEEKRRGITIDLGFASLPLTDELSVSLVDVPGHEGFIKNMLAGTTGIDVVLLVIAADDGLMPQTEEHLAIVELLGIGSGVPVITKRDLVDSAGLARVRVEVTERLARSRVRWEPPVAVSALTGVGLDTLRAALCRVAERVADRPTDDYFRLPIDRVFALPGAGTVVTGSTWSGTVAVGESVRLLPSGRTARVRSIEVHSRPAERALPGRRTALALVGVDREELRRGDVAVTGTGWTATRAFDAAIEVLPVAPRAITARTRLRVHLGTAAVLARAIQLGSIAPGARGLARFALETPLISRGGDRFVLRSFSPVTTIGGGVVLDPEPPIPGPRLRHRGMTPEQPLPERLSRWAAEAGLAGVSLPDLPVRLGVSPQRLELVVQEAGATLARCGDVVVTSAALEEGCERVRAAISRHHADHPLDAGMSIQAIRAVQGMESPLRGAPALAVLDHILVMGGKRGVGGWELAGGVARLVGWRPSLDGRTAVARSELLQRLAEAGWRIPTIRELRRDLAGVTLPPLLAHLAREGVIEQVDQERYAAPEALRSFRGALLEALRDLGEATPAQLRDRLALTRKFLIPLLEWADRRGITERRGDTRHLTLTARTGGS